MRKSLCLVAGCFLVWGTAGLARADDQAEARALVDEAIEAAGGQEKLAKHKAATWTETGTYYGMGDGLPYTGNCAVQWPEQLRLEIVGVFTMVLNGEKGWIKSDNMTREMSLQQLAQQKEEHYGGWVATLLPLADKPFTLATAGEVDVDGRPALGVTVSSKGHRDVKLFFDKDSGLLAKSQHRVQSPEQGFQEVEEEVFYNDYQEVDGAKIPMKIS